MTLEEFSLMSGISVNQIKKRYREIGGITKDEEGYHIPNGTRYPIRRPTHIESRNEKVYLVLKAIFLYKYIDAVMLRIPHESFELILEEMKTIGWIQENKTNNPFGANRFDTTLLGGEIIQKKKTEALREIAGTLSYSAGLFVKGVQS